MKKLMCVNLYTDGSYRPSTGIGSYAGILQVDDHVQLVCNAMDDTTINRQELLAVISSLNTLIQPCEVTIYSDSTYVVNGLNEWMHGWVKRGWVNAKRVPTPNRDLWEVLYSLSKQHKLKAVHVKAHTGQDHHPYFENNIVDNIAQGLSLQS